MSAAPTGDVALVFTDIEGSTALWEQHPRAMSEALAVHDALLRATLADAGGYEVKTEGDAFMVAFAGAAEAVRWCLVVQEGLSKMAWPAEIGELRVRMGVHAGRPECRPDPVTGRMDYFGSMVNRAARVSAAAHGGQILLSGAAAEAAGVAVAADVAVEELGEHRLKGLRRPEPLRSVLPRSLAHRTFPPPRTLTLRLDLAPRKRHRLDRGGLDDALRRAAEALAARGEVRRWQGKADEAEDDLDAALVCARKLGDPAVEAFVLVNLGRLFFMTSRVAAARDLFADARDLARTAGDRWTEATSVSYVAACDTGLGNHLASLEGYHEALELSRAIGNTRQEAVLLSNIGRHHLIQGALEEAEGWFREAVARLEVGHDDVVIGAINNLGVVAAELDRDDAATILERALAISLRVGDRRMEGVVRANLGAWLTTRGRLDEAEVHGRGAVGALVEMSDPINAGIAATSFAVLLQQTGRGDEAEALLRDRHAAFDDWPETVEADLLARLGAVVADAGRSDEAADLLDRAAALAGDAEPHRTLVGLARGHLDRDAAPPDVDASRSAELRLARAALEHALAAGG